jgi:ElaB/YqjD/DUF883 family membrane-anchored ribosome-binding protein
MANIQNNPSSEQNATKSSQNKLTENAHQIVDNISGKASSAVDKAGETYENVKKMFNDAGHNIQEQSEQLYDVMAKYVRENPMKAVGIAAAAGCVLAMALRKLGD